MQPSPGQDMEAPRGGWQEVLRVALPLILANSFWTLQITIDRVVLSRAVTAAPSPPPCPPPWVYAASTAPGPSTEAADTV